MQDVRHRSNEDTQSDLVRTISEELEIITASYPQVNYETLCRMHDILSATYLSKEACALAADMVPKQEFLERLSGIWREDL